MPRAKVSLTSCISASDMSPNSALSQIQKIELVRNALDLIKRNVIAGAVIELRGARALVCCHLQRVLKRSTVLEIDRDAGRTERVAAELRLNAGRRCPTPVGVLRNRTRRPGMTCAYDSRARADDDRHRRHRPGDARDNRDRAAAAGLAGAGMIAPDTPVAARELRSPIGQ